MQTIQQQKALSLTRRARELHPNNRRLAAKWVLSVRELRKNNLWILDGAKADWDNRPKRALRGAA